MDDAKQNNPSRPGMGPLVAIGGIHVPSGSVRDFETGVEALCSDYGFPARTEFKWSPGKDLWMRKGLVQGRREKFFTDVLALAEDYRASSIVVIADTTCETATGAETCELDVTQMFLERAHNLLHSKDSHGVIIIARPGGDRASENKFLADCLDTLQSGTDYVKPDCIALNVLSSPPEFIRLLQVADVVVSCTTAAVGGEDQHSPPIFDCVKRLFVKELDRIGGVGLKLHADYKYANLYYWLLGDSHFWKHNVGNPLPIKGLRYASNPLVP